MKLIKMYCPYHQQMQQIAKVLAIFFCLKQDCILQFYNFTILQFSYAIIGGKQPGLEIWDPETGQVELVLKKWGDENDYVGVIDANVILMQGKFALFSIMNHEEL